MIDGWMPGNSEAGVRSKSAGDVCIYTYAMLRIIVVVLASLQVAATLGLLLFAETTIGALLFFLACALLTVVGQTVTWLRDTSTGLEFGAALTAFILVLRFHPSAGVTVLLWIIGLSAALASAVILRQMRQG
jgi:hypothetical protein